MATAPHGHINTKNMGRIKLETIDRTTQFACRVIDLAEALEAQRRSRRIVDQVIGAGTSVGANLAEASEAMSRADFVRSLSICVKELSECLFWFEIVTRRTWVSPERLQPLVAEARELKLILGAMISRTRRNAAVSKHV